MRLLRQGLHSPEPAAARWHSLHSACHCCPDKSVWSFLDRNAKNQYSGLVSALTLTARKLSLLDLQEKKKRWTHWKQWLFLDPLKTWAHREHRDPKIQGEEWMQIITAQIYLLGSEDTRTTNYREYLHSNSDELLEVSCGLLWQWESLGPQSQGSLNVHGLYLQQPQQVLKVNPEGKLSYFWQGDRKNNF